MKDFSILALKAKKPKEKQEGKKETKNKLSNTV
jgi:hypothetical protein